MFILAPSLLLVIIYIIANHKGRKNTYLPVPKSTLKSMKDLGDADLLAMRLERSRASDDDWRHSF